MGWGDRVRQMADGLKRLPEGVAQLQQQAITLHDDALSAATGHDAGGPGWDPLAWLPPPSEFVKRGECVSCGAAKQLPTVRPHLYCDFCGQLTDYDLRRASESAVTSPQTAAYAAVANQIGPQLPRARRSGDRAAFEALQRQLQAAQAELTPWAVPPRAWNDEQYRRRWIDFTTAGQVLAAFDPEHQRLTEQVTSLALRVQWRGGMGLGAAGGGIAMARRVLTGGLDPATMTPKAELASLRPMADACMAQLERGLELNRVAGLREIDPDDASDELSRRLTRSMLAQGWLTHLEPEEGQVFIEWLGLRHEYQRSTTGEDERRGCAGCGHHVTVLPGATRVVCDACGRALDVAGPRAVCTGCNAGVCFVAGATHLNCPYCAAEMRRT